MDDSLQSAHSEFMITALQTMTHLLIHLLIAAYRQFLRIDYGSQCHIGRLVEIGAADYQSEAKPRAVVSAEKYCLQPVAPCDHH